MLSERALRECGGLAAKGYNSTYLTVSCTPGYDATVVVVHDTQSLIAHIPP